MVPIGSEGFFSTTNFCNILSALAVAPLLVLPAFADVIDVGISGSVNGSGDLVIVCCSGEGVARNSFSFSGTNTQLGTFSRSGQASAMGTGDGDRTLTASGLVQQKTEVASNSFTIDLVSQFIVPSMTGAEWGVNGSLSNDYEMGFTLTAESSMHLTSQISSGGAFSIFSPVADLESFGGIPIIDLTSPGASDLTLTLEPGQYSINFFAGTEFQHGPHGIFNPETDDFANLSLSATFAVPEPHWTPLVPGLLGIGYCIIQQRRRARAWI